MVKSSGLAVVVTRVRGTVKRMAHEVKRRDGPGRPRLLASTVTIDGVEVPLLDAVVAAAEKGLPLADCARRVGASPDTLYAWLARGRQARNLANGVPDDELDFVVLVQRVEAAQSKARYKAVDKLDSLIDSEDETVALKASMFTLERGDPMNWGRATRQMIEAAPDEQAERERDRQAMGARFYSALRAILVDLDIDVHDTAVVEVVRKHLLAASVDDRAPVDA